MACLPPPIMHQEQEYFELLETTETYLIHNEKLIITCSDNKEMVFIEKGTEEEPPEEAPDIEDMVWQLESYGDRGSLEPLVSGTKITVELQSDDGRVVGSAGCNSYFGDYEIDGFELTIIPPISSTMMLCFPSDVMEQEHEYLDLLKTTETFLVNNEKLIISCADNKEMVFIEEIPSIEDITWELEAYGDVGSLEPPLAGTTITAQLKSGDGQVVGSSGCNSYFVDYEIDGYELTIIPPISSTMMLCFPNDVMAQEHDYLDLLGDAESFRIQDDKLVIEVSGDKELVFIEQ